MESTLKEAIERIKENSEPHTRWHIRLVLNGNYNHIYCRYAKENGTDLDLYASDDTLVSRIFLKDIKCIQCCNEDFENLLSDLYWRYD